MAIENSAITLADVTGGIGAVKQLDETVSTIAKLVAKLKADPDQAALRLAAALNEIEKTCKAVDEAIVKYLALGLEEGALDKGSMLLLEVGGGGLVIAVERGRGHCHMIGNIHRNYLDRWFERVFKRDTDSLKAIRGVFDRLGSADQDMFAEMLAVAKVVQARANDVLTLVASEKREEARNSVKSSLKDLLPLQVRINTLMSKLFELRAQFISIAGLS
jgi:hypothetical protein